jgi:hypothetical protein
VRAFLARAQRESWRVIPSHDPQMRVAAACGRGHEIGRDGS